VANLYRAAAMADADACDLIEEWARAALEQASLDLPEDVSVSASSGGGEGDVYSLTVEVPEGSGAQQRATSIQSALTDAVADDPTLGGRFPEVSFSPAGADLVGFGDTGAQSKFELTVVTGEDDGGEGSDDREDDESGDGDDDDKSDDGDDDDESGDGDEDDKSDDGDDDDESGDGDEDDKSDDGDDDESDDGDKSDDGDDKDDDGDDKDDDAAKSDS
jgi:hypothetical protein